MAQHSSGPWEIRRTGNRAQDISIFTEGAAPSSGCICKIPYRDGRQATVEANAKLIAAAPDLLALLKSINDAGVFGEEDWPRIAAAVAKASVPC